MEFYTFLVLRWLQLHLAYWCKAQSRLGVDVLMGRLPIKPPRSKYRGYPRLSNRRPSPKIRQRRLLWICHELSAINPAPVRPLLLYLLSIVSKES
jgi:hypothetical protein